MKRPFLLTTFLLVLVSVIGTSVAFARGSQQNSDIVTGAQIYDRWYAALGVSAPQGNMPIWNRQSTNTRSGLDTWRCSECHGWDYKGVDGAYVSGSHETGFPGLLPAVNNMTEADVVAQLKGEKDPEHDFSQYIDDAALQKVALFLKDGLIDDSEYINPVSLKVLNGDMTHGQQLFEQVCAGCHGTDGTKIIFRTEGVDEYLGDVANHLHLLCGRCVAGTEMPVGYELGWTPADGRDVLMYAQTLTRSLASPEVTDAGAGSGPNRPIGGPASNLWTGILTGLGIFLGMLGGALALFAILALVGVTVIFALRRSK